VYIAEDVTRKPGEYVRTVKAVAARWHAQGLRAVGIRRRRNVVIEVRPAIAHATAGRVRPKVTRSANRPIEQKVTDLEADVSKHEDQIADANDAIERVQKDVEELPDKLRALMELVAEERIQQ